MAVHICTYIIHVCHTHIRTYIPCLQRVVSASLIAHAEFCGGMRRKCSVGHCPRESCSWSSAFQIGGAFHSPVMTLHTYVQKQKEYYCTTSAEIRSCDVVEVHAMALNWMEMLLSNHLAQAFLTTQLESGNRRKRTMTWRLNSQPKL